MPDHHQCTIRRKLQGKRCGHQPLRSAALNGAENIPLFRTTIGVKIRFAWKDSGRGLLVVPLGPRQCFLEMRLNSRTNTWPFRATEHVDKIEICCNHGLQSAIADEFLYSTAPMGQSLGSAGETNAPLVHGQAGGT